MSDDPLAAYLETVDPDYGDLVTATHEAILATGAPFDVAVKYHMLMYTLDKKWRHWVCGISQQKNAVNLRFLYGIAMDDPKDLLRQGSSILFTMDIPSMEAFDAATVTAYVQEALDKRDWAIEHNAELEAKAKKQAAKR